MKYISLETYAKERRSFLFRKGENQIRKNTRRITRSFFTKFFSHPEVRRAKNYCFLNVLMEMSQKKSLLTERGMAKATSDLSNQDCSFNYHDHLAWAVRSGYVNSIYAVTQPSGNGLEFCCTLSNRELNSLPETCQTAHLGYTINQKNIEMLIKYQKPNMERIIDQYKRGLGMVEEVLFECSVALFKRRT